MYNAVKAGGIEIIEDLVSKEYGLKLIKTIKGKRHCAGSTCSLMHYLVFSKTNANESVNEGPHQGKGHHIDERMNDVDNFAGSDPKAGSTIKGTGFNWDKNTVRSTFLKKERAQLMRDREQEAEHHIDERIDDEDFDSLEDAIANREFGMDYNHLGPNEKEWVRDKMSMNERIDFDEALNLRAIKVEIEDEIIQLRREMEDEGDESKANYYGGKLNKLEDKLSKVKKQLDDYDMNESVGKSKMPTQSQVDRFFILTQNETHYLNSKPVQGQKKTSSNMEVEPWDEYDLSNWNALVKKAKDEDNSYARVSMPIFKKDKNNPNFLYVNIKYDLGPGGSSIALGKQTMTGQIRSKSAAEAMRLAGDVARDLKAEYDLEDIDIVDKENGVVQVFAISDDFINMDPNMLGESLNENDEEEEIDYSNISSLEDELRRLRCWSSQYGSKGADSKIEYLEQRIEYLKSNPLNEAKEEDKIDIITMDVPLFIRALEYAKEDAQEDMDLHDFAERAIAATKEQGILQMDDYDMLIGGKEPMDESNITEASVPSNIKSFAKEKGVTALVNKVAGWAEEVGARISGGTAIGYNYSTLVLDMKHQAGEIRINTDNDTIKLYNTPVNSLAQFKKVYDEKKPIDKEKTNENIAQKVIDKIKEAKPGLWANINAKKKRGEKPSHGNSDAFKSAVKAGKEINKLKEEEGVPHDSDLMAAANGIASTLGKELKAKQGEEKQLDEAIVTSAIAAVLTGNALIGFISKMTAKLMKKLNYKKGEDIAEKIHHWAHDNETAFQAPIKRVLAFFIKDKQKLDITTKAIYAIVIAGMAAGYGADAVSSLGKADWFKSALASLKTLAKSDEAIVNAYPAIKSLMV